MGTYYRVEVIRIDDDPVADTVGDNGGLCKTPEVDRTAEEINRRLVEWKEGLRRQKTISPELEKLRFDILKTY